MFVKGQGLGINKNLNTTSHVVLKFLFFSSFILFWCYSLSSIWPFTIDDAYIPLRYAKNWALYGEPVWNLNTLRVEGYSSFLFMAFAAFLIKYGCSPILFLKSAGLVGLIATLGSSYLLAKELMSRKLIFFVPLSFAIYNGTIVWAASGLETMVYTAQLLFGLYAFLKGIGLEKGDFKAPINHFFLIVAGIIFGFSGLTRPEAPFFMFLFFLCALTDQSLLKKEGFLKGIFLSLAVFLFIWAPYFIWRFHYYGRFFQNTVYCKGWNGSFLGELTIHFLKLCAPFFVIALPFIYQKRRLAYFLMLPVLSYMILLMNADPVSAFLNRLFLPIFPFVLLASFSGLDIFLKNTAAKPWVFLISGVLITLLLIPKFSPTAFRHFSENPVSGEKLRKEMAIWLHHHVKDFENIVLGDAGLIPFLSEHRFTDSWCLNNPEMGRLPPKKMFQSFCKKVFDERPFGIILTVFEGEHGAKYAPSDACLKKRLEKRKDYYLAKALSSKQTNSQYRYEIYLARVDN